MKQIHTDRLNPTEEQKARMLRGIREKHERLHAPRHKVLQTALIAAVFCILIGTSAFAAVSFGLMDGLRTFLQPATPEQAELLAQGAYVVDKIDRNPNGTLEVKQVIGDSNLVYLLLEFTAPEGTVLDLDGYRFNGSLDAGRHTTGAGFVKIADADENDNLITLVMCAPTRAPIAGKHAKLKLSDLEGANMGADYQTVLTGSWSVSFPLDFEDCSITYPVAQTLSAEGYDITLQSISISPLSVTLRANSPYTREISQSLNEKYAPYSDNSPRWFPVTIHYADGSTETSSRSVRMGSTSEMNHLSGDILDIITFDSLINSKTIDSIEICGTAIALPQE